MLSLQTSYYTVRRYLTGASLNFTPHPHRHPRHNDFVTLFTCVFFRVISYSGYHFFFTKASRSGQIQ